ncbi:hypothetical protein [Kineococcus sp. NPDC059986]|uniref:hypothetical protein n=1 Tax=Kineococcus sp. NPDC059986 TaxID=3155538 RepID=UPI0034509284
MPEPLRLLPVLTTGSGPSAAGRPFTDSDNPHERVRALLQPRFLQPVVVPEPGDVALWGRTCTITGCEGWDAHGTPVLCAVHRNRLRYLRTSLSRRRGESRGSDLTRQGYCQDADLHGGPAGRNHPGYDFTDLPPRLEIELRLLLQLRCEQQRTLLRRHELQTIKKTARTAGLTSLLPSTPQPVENRWMTSHEVPAATWAVRRTSAGSCCWTTAPGFIASPAWPPANVRAWSVA